MRVVATVVVSGFIAAFAASAANAQTATQDITISATVTKACTINNVATGSPVGTATIPVSAAGAVTTTAITPTGSPFLNVACNAASTMQLSSVNGGALNATLPGSGFTNVINYSATATWASATANLTTSGAPVVGSSVAIAAANSGSLAVSITPIANTLPLVVGAYSDTLRVTLTAP